MTKILEGIRVIEMASWVFVPAAGAILADHGADVIKVEQPAFPDPCRGLRASNFPKNAPNIMLETANRGKRSIGLDITTDEGRAVLRKLVESADVFLTSMLTDVRRKLRVDVDDIRAWNPGIVYARGSGLGVRGPEANRPSFDGAAYWYRSGAAYSMTPDTEEWPVGQRPGIGDLPSGAMLAGGVMGALFARERTGTPPLVDVSLISSGAWTFAPDMVNGRLNPGDEPVRFGAGSANPLGHLYKTKDRRVISLHMMDSDRYWEDFCRTVGREDLLAEPRYDHSSKRDANTAELVAIFDEVFAAKTLSEWTPILRTMKGAWGVVQKPADFAYDPQVEANGILQPVLNREQDLWLAAAPVQYDETPSSFTRMPAHGEHTDEVVGSLGYTWDEIVDMKLSGALL
jgi:crotonobetainyl-CoA:carnitine CoA-transferase CaiB-like acyl-CoA transferase